MATQESLPLLLKQLKLTAIKDKWEELTLKAMDKNLDYGDYLAQLLEVEVLSLIHI